MIDNILFPLPLAFGASGGPSRAVQIYIAASGREQRSSAHFASRRRYDAGLGVKTLDDMHMLISFFEARGGQLRGFLFRDPMDHKSCAPSEDIAASDQNLAAVNGSTTRYKLTKNYGDAVAHYARRITHPRLETLAVNIDGQPASFTWDGSAKEIVLDGPSPGVVTAGFEFDTPVRFDTPSLTLALQAFGAGQAALIPLIEVIDYA